jgi:hypothetical protein
MQARRLTTILPHLTLAEAIDTPASLAAPAAPGGAPPSSPPGRVAPPTSPWPMGD